MPTTIHSDTEHLRSAVQLAVRAPSIYNTQPWRWALRADGLELYADRSRQLTVVDPDGHALLISCGAAVELARLGLAVAGCHTEVYRTPDPTDADLLARIVVIGHAAVSDDIRLRAMAARRRYSERRPFTPRAVSGELLELLAAAICDDGVFLHVVQRADERLDLAVLVSRADQALCADPDYRQELARWTRGGPADDGIPASAVPHVVGAERRHADVPLRDFEVGITGALPVQGGQDEDPVLAVIMTADRGADGCLRAGEALARLLVDAQVYGLAASIISQPVDWPVLRERMRALMSWCDHPQILLRIGWPSAGTAGTPTPRRPISDVIDLRS
jgi:nitroreductase